MAEAIYLLCSLTSALCSILLFRAYRKNSLRLLLWSGLCFVGFLFNNLLLFLDLVILPEIDLSSWRLVPAVVGVIVLTYGLIWDVA